MRFLLALLAVGILTIAHADTVPSPRELSDDILRQRAEDTALSLQRIRERLTQLAE